MDKDKDKHVTHEAWHTVQQKQGRVQPTVQVCSQASTKYKINHCGHATKIKALGLL